MTSRPSVLFLSHSAALGGAEFSLVDVVTGYDGRSEVLLFESGPLESLLEQRQVSFRVAKSSLDVVRRGSGVIAAVRGAGSLVPLVYRVWRAAKPFEVLFANTQKAMLVGAAVRVLTAKPLILHLHDILSAEHFGRLNRRMSVAVANRFCDRVIADSAATRAAFIAAGGNPEIVSVIHYGFEPGTDPGSRQDSHTRTGWPSDAFVVGHFGRLSPWKGQDIFLRAIADCPEVKAIVVGAALFDEGDIETRLRELASDLGLDDRVSFLGFRSDVPELMAACDLVVHSSTSPEPFGRVIVEAMMEGTPVVAAAAGGPLEIIEDGVNGWLTSPGDAAGLAHRIDECHRSPKRLEAVAGKARERALSAFSLVGMQAAFTAAIIEVGSRETRTRTTA